MRKKESELSQALGYPTSHMIRWLLLQRTFHLFFIPFNLPWEERMKDKRA